MLYPGCSVQHAYSLPQTIRMDVRFARTRGVVWSQTELWSGRPAGILARSIGPLQAHDLPWRIATRT